MATQQMRVDFTGNLAADPDLKQIDSSGLVLVEFRVLVTPRKKVKGEWKDTETMTLKCTAWRDLAENIGATFRKGMRVHVQGTVTQETYEKRAGGTGTSLVVEVEQASPSLEYATAQVVRRERAPGQGGGYQQQAAPVQSDPWATATPGGGGIPVPEQQADVWGASR